MIDMNCESIRIRLKTWLDGEVRGERASWIEEHLAGCPACRDVAADFRRLGGLFRRAEPLPAPLPSAARLRARARRVRREEESTIRLLKRMAGAAAAVLLVTLGLGLWSFSADAGRPRLAESNYRIASVQYYDVLTQFLSGLEVLAMPEEDY
jgi:predicted anti-sigma-YlaC factor YlaD